MRRDAQKNYQEKRQNKAKDKQKNKPVNTEFVKKKTEAKKASPQKSGSNKGKKVDLPEENPVVTKKEKTKKKKSVKNKEFAKITYAFVALFMCMMAYIVYFQVVESDDIINSPYNPRQDLLAAEVIRGDIYDADGNLLAETIIAEDGSETRYYPYGPVYAHAVGYNVYGKAGVELSENFNLLTSNAFFVEKITNEFQDEKDMGDSVYTTLNSTLQQAAYDALGGYNGAIVILEPSTGKILAMVSKESYDTNQVGQYWSDLTTHGNSVMLNRATQGAYAPGSVFKTVTLLEYMREYPDYENYRYNCTGSYEKDGTIISCSHGAVHGEQTLAQAYANSCNACFSDLGLQLNIDSLNQTASSLLFNQPLPGDVISGSSSFSLEATDSSAEIMMTAIGQGDTLTNPYHMALITSAIANGGKLMSPYIVSRIENYTGSVVETYKPQSYGDLMTNEEAKVLASYMSGVVQSGTATTLSGQSYTVVGKTGTAEYSSDKSKSHSWFTGFTNPDNPELAFAVIIEGSDGTARATEVIKQVLNKYY